MPVAITRRVMMIRIAKAPPLRDIRFCVMSRPSRYGPSYKMRFRKLWLNRGAIISVGIGLRGVTATTKGLDIVYVISTTGPTKSLCVLREIILPEIPRQIEGVCYSMPVARPAWPCGVLLVLCDV